MEVDGLSQPGPKLTGKVIYLGVVQCLSERQRTDIARVVLNIDLSFTMVKKLCRREAKLIARAFQELERQEPPGYDPELRNEIGFCTGSLLERPDCRFHSCDFPVSGFALPGPG